jgi:hypothetical protein
MAERIGDVSMADAKPRRTGGRQRRKAAARLKARKAEDQALFAAYKARDALIRENMSNPRQRNYYAAIPSSVVLVAQPSNHGPRGTPKQGFTPKLRTVIAGETPRLTGDGTDLHPFKVKPKALPEKVSSEQLDKRAKMRKAIENRLKG